MQEYFSIQEVADMLGVKKVTIYRMIKKGELPYYQLGKLIRIKREDFEKFMQTRRQEGEG